MKMQRKTQGKTTLATTRTRRLLAAWQKNGVNVAGRIWEVGAYGYLLATLSQTASLGVMSSLRPIASSLMFIFSAHLAATDRNNLKFQASCVTGIIGTFGALYPRIASGERDALFAFGVNAAINTYGLFNKQSENEFQNAQNAICRRTFGRPNLMYGLALLIACYAPAIHNGLAHITRPDGMVQTGLYTIFAAAAVVFAGSKPNASEPSLPPQTALQRTSSYKSGSRPS